MPHTDILLHHLTDMHLRHISQVGCTSMSDHATSGLLSRNSLQVSLQHPADMRMLCIPARWIVEWRMDVEDKSKSLLSPAEAKAFRDQRFSDDTSSRRAQAAYWNMLELCAFSIIPFACHNMVGCSHGNCKEHNYFSPKGPAFLGVLPSLHRVPWLHLMHKFFTLQLWHPWTPAGAFPYLLPTASKIF